MKERCKQRKDPGYRPKEVSLGIVFFFFFFFFFCFFITSCPWPQSLLTESHGKTFEIVEIV